MQGDYIGNLKQLVKIRIREGFRLLDPVVFIIGYHLHSQCLGNSPRGLADPAITNDSHGFARQLDQRVIPEAPVRVFRPSAFLHCLIMMPDVMADLQQQSDGKLSHRICTISRDIGYHNPPLLGRLHVHHIVAGSQDADISDFLACI